MRGREGERKVGKGGGAKERRKGGLSVCVGGGG